MFVVFWLMVIVIFSPVTGKLKSSFNSSVMLIVSVTVGIVVLLVDMMMLVFRGSSSNVLNVILTGYTIL